MSGFDGFEDISGGVAAPKSSVVPEHGSGGDFDPFAAASASAVSQPLSNPSAAAQPAVAHDDEVLIPAADATSPVVVATPTNTTADTKVEEKKDTPYTEWERKRQALLQEKQAKANEAKKALIATAKADIVKFLAQRDERIAQRKLENRAEERTAAAAAKNVKEHGALFEKVGKLVDTTAKSNEKRPGVERFRKLLINLKTNAPVHLGGAGGGSADSKDSKA